MAEFPALPLWTDAILGDTMHLSIEEFGAYTMLLIVSWRSPGCDLPDDDVDMARYCRVTARRWRERLRPRLKPFFVVAEGRWNQKRLQKERRYVARNSAKKAENGAKGGRAKALKSKETTLASAVAPIPIPNIPPSSLSKDKLEAPPDDDLKIPEFLKRDEPRKKRASAMPKDFSPDKIPDDMRGFAKTKGVVGPRAEQQWGRFVNHHTAKGSRFVDWMAAWRNWVGMIDQFTPAGKPQPMGGGIENPREATLEEREEYAREQAAKGGTYRVPDDVPAWWKPKETSKCA
ncbi:MAG: DUF1376 domain-containing protein [bacterium]|nr:DUF1376 domain-containing protein [bacterium]